jgi:hypothetical protein
MPNPQYGPFLAIMKADRSAHEMHIFNLSQESANAEHH